MSRIEAIASSAEIAPITNVLLLEKHVISECDVKWLGLIPRLSCRTVRTVRFFEGIIRFRQFGAIFWT